MHILPCYEVCWDGQESQFTAKERTNLQNEVVSMGKLRDNRPGRHSPHLFCQPAKMSDLTTASNARLPQLFSDVSNDSHQQVTNVGMDGTEPGLGGGGVLCPQDHCVLSIWRVDFKLPGEAKGERR